ncbi:putative ribonuclease H-like domain-containing protein [Tanacetum coccineum]
MNKMYCLDVTDDFSRFSWVFFLATKDETSEILKTFITGIENLKDLRVKVIRCDNGTEFKNRVINQFYEMKGIKREFSVVRTPQQNGVAERKNRILIEAVRTMLADSKLPTTFWAEAVNTACYVQNRVLVIKPHNKTPYELFLGRKPTLSFMRPFGCPVTILNTIDHLRSGPNWLFDIDALTKSMNYKPVVVGNQSNGSADPPFSSSLKDSLDAGCKPSGEKEKKDTKDPRNESEASGKDSEDNAIDENIVYGCTDDLNIPDFEEDSIFGYNNPIFDYSNDDEDVSAEADMTNLDTHIPVSPILTTNIHKNHPVEQIIGDIHSAPQTRRMTKSVTKHDMFSSVQQRTNHKDFHNYLFACFLSQAEPKKVWTLVDLPHDKRAIGTKWVYRNKKDERGIVIKNKARLVAQGHRQREGIDYDEMDAKSAFLYGKIEEEVCVCQPLGFEDPNFADRVYKVEKVLYGLHQAPRA